MNKMIVFSSFTRHCALNPTMNPGPPEQVALHCLSMLGEITQGHRPHVAFHLKGILRAVLQLVIPSGG